MNYNFDNFQDQWVKTIDDICEKYGSWDTRKHYQAWKMVEIQ